jgi:hypothetical protein
LVVLLACHCSGSIAVLAVGLCCAWVSAVLLSLSRSSGQVLGPGAQQGAHVRVIVCVGEVGRVGRVKGGIR